MLDQLKGGAERASRSLNLLDVATRGIQIAGIAVTARALVQAGDALTQGLSRLQNATGLVERAGQVYEALSPVPQEVVDIALAERSLPLLFWRQADIRHETTPPQHAMANLNIGGLRVKTNCQETPHAHPRPPGQAVLARPATQCPRSVREPVASRRPASRGRRVGLRGDDHAALAELR